MVSALIYKFHEAKEAPAVGRGLGHRHDPTRALFVDDLADAMIHFMDHVDAKDIGTFVNIGLGHDIAVGDLAASIKEIVGYAGEIVFDASKPDGMPRKLMDVSRAARLGWTAKIGIPEGLRLTYDWYLENVAVEVVEQ